VVYTFRLKTIDFSLHLLSLHLLSFHLLSFHLPFL
jgi:hypothetical protein